jgi:hypothetical protein
VAMQARRFFELLKNSASANRLGLCWTLQGAIAGSDLSF